MYALMRNCLGVNRPQLTFFVSKIQPLVVVVVVVGRGGGYLHESVVVVVRGLMVCMKWADHYKNYI